MQTSTWAATSTKAPKLTNTPNLEEFVFQLFILVTRLVQLLLETRHLELEARVRRRHARHALAVRCLTTKLLQQRQHLVYNR